MPDDFPYRDVLAKGYPAHCQTDHFRLKHPSIDQGRRAKIFSPFDALKGFNETVAEKGFVYENRRELEEAELQELNRRLTILQGLTSNSRFARENQVRVSVTYFISSMGEGHPVFGYRGKYVTKNGIVRKIVFGYLVVDEIWIPLTDIFSLESEHRMTDLDSGEIRPIFERPWCD